MAGPPIAELGVKVVGPERVIVVFDHKVPADNASNAELHRLWREFCKHHGIEHLHDVGNQGISHVISVERGYARPGTLQANIVPTPTPAALLAALPRRWEWISSRIWYSAGTGIAYRRACVSICRRLSEVSGTRIDQAFLGSCAGGHLSDLRAAASVLRGRKVHRDVRMVVSPATQEIWTQAQQEGLRTLFTHAGGLVTAATCGACFGGMGALAKGEVCVSNSTENFPGRMGNLQSQAGK